MSDTEQLLRLSLLYRNLITDLEAVVGGNWSATEKHRMVRVVSDVVDEAVIVKQRAELELVR